ncbi:MAG: class I SAM-dependent methyltransferase, partial [Leptospira sp.]|nr:class I SAM-dependent methyltransferase [Leptospira sp.]
MIAEQTIISGVLGSDGAEERIEVCGHTRYSFRIRIPGETTHDSPFIAERLMIQLDGNEIELGKCKLIPVKGTVPLECIVLFLDDIIDTIDLIGRKRVTVYDTGLFNLHFILNQKDKVNHRFKEYTANLTFELNVYKQYFDDLDLLYLKEPGQVQEHLQRMIIEREGEAFTEFFESKMRQLEDLTKNFAKDGNEAHGFFFRKQAWHFILHSPFMVRTNLKPRGYAGDYEMMKMIYDDEVIGPTIFSRLVNSYPLRIPAAEAVRNRRKMIARNLREEIESHANSDFRAMSVACGPAEEVTEALCDLTKLGNVHFTLLDQDTEALRTAMNSINQLGFEKGWSIDVRYINDSVRSMLRIRDLATEWGRYDFIYSMGLFDYLTPPVARAVLARLYQMLRPGGRLLIGNFHPRNQDRAFMEYWLDWVLYHRSEEEMLELAVTLPGHSRVFFEDSGCQM